MVRKKLLLLTDWFDPAFRAGGPITSCVNLVKTYGRYHDIYVLTSATDIDNTCVVTEDQANKWVSYIQGVKVWYCTEGSLSIARLKKLVSNIEPDAVYCNSMFSKNFTVYPLILKRLGMLRARLVLAPRGMLKESALSYKKKKKQLFLMLLKQAGMKEIVRFQATDTQEMLDVKLIFGDVKVFEVGNFPSPVFEQVPAIPKKAGELNILFLGRIHSIKQLDYLLDSLKSVNGKVSLKIVGPIEDTQYWMCCKEIIQILPGFITVEYLGEKAPALLPEIIQAAHLMALPTKGENFGHAIYETLASSRPVLISNKTPWRDLASVKAGYDIELEDKSEFIRALQHMIDMDAREYASWSDGAGAYARAYLHLNNTVSKYNDLFFSYEG